MAFVLVLCCFLMPRPVKAQQAKSARAVEISSFSNAAIADSLLRFTVREIRYHLGAGNTAIAGKRDAADGSPALSPKAKALIADILYRHHTDIAASVQATKAGDADSLYDMAYSRRLYENLRMQSSYPLALKHRPDPLEPALFRTLQAFTDSATFADLNTPLTKKGVVLGMPPAINLQLPDSLRAACLALLRRENGFPDASAQRRGVYDRGSINFSLMLGAAVMRRPNPDDVNAVKPYVKSALQLWYDMLNPLTGCPNTYGRGRQFTIDDNFERIYACLLYPDISPASKPELLQLFIKTYNYWLSTQYNPATHRARSAEFGRAADDVPGQKPDPVADMFGTLQKADRCLGLLPKLSKADEKKLQPISQALSLPEVSRLQWFRNGTGRKMGLWVYRNNRISFAMPVTGSPFRGANADNLPMPYGFPGIQVPANSQLPCLVPHLTLPSGTVITTAEGADTLSLSPDGSTLRMVTEEWATPSGALTTPGIRCITLWKADKNVLEQEISMLVPESAIIDRFRYCLPTSFPLANPDRGGLMDDEGNLLAVRFESEFHEELRIRSTGNSLAGRSVFGPVPLLLDWEAADFVMTAGQPYVSKLVLGWQQAKDAKEGQH